MTSTSDGSACETTIGFGTKTFLLCRIGNAKTARDTATAPAAAPGNPKLIQFRQKLRRLASTWRTAASTLALKKAEGSTLLALPNKAHNSSCSGSFISCYSTLGYNQSFEADALNQVVCGPVPAASSDRASSSAKIAQEWSGFQLVSGFQKAFELADPGRMTHFAQGFRFNLPDAFPGNAELAADLLKGPAVTVH